MFVPAAGCILIGLGLSAVAGIAMLIIGENKGRDSLSALGWLAFVPGLLGTIAWGALWGSFAATSFGDVQNMRAFYNDTKYAYEYTIDATQSVIIDATGTRDGAWTDFGYQEQGKTVSERIKEFRDKVEGYNKTLQRLRAINNVPVIGSMFYDPPDDLKPIRLTR